MEKTIKTTDLLDYIETYNKYEYLIDKIIAKKCPKYIINDEDFKQDVKLALLEYIKDNESFNKLTRDNLKYSYVYRYIHKIVDLLYIRYATYRSNNVSLDNYDAILTYDDTDIVNFIMDHDLNYILDNVLSTIDDREAYAIKLYYFNDDMNNKKAGEIMNISPERARNILTKGLRHMRHPARSKNLKDYLR